MGKVKANCEFCGDEFETTLIAGMRRGSYCKRCVKLRVWFEGRGRRIRQEEIKSRNSGKTQ